MLVSFLFFVVALLYSAVGFGGGSSYIAILALLEYPYQSIPIIALVCNLIVVTGGVIQFARQGHFRWPLFWPFAVASIPMAFVGGRIPISKEVFLSLLGICLLLAGMRLLLGKRIGEIYEDERIPSLKVALPIGAILGLLSGLVGIGGGIFLAPALLLLGWGKPKQVAATASLFIFTNSIFGLMGQLFKQSLVIHSGDYWPLFLAVLVGGQIGSRLGAGQVLSSQLVKNLTAVLVTLIGLKIILS